MKRKPHLLQESRQNKTLGQINATCAFDYDIGHHHIFNVAQKRKISSKAKRHVACPVSGIEVYSEERPNFSDFNVFIGAIKVFQKYADRAYSARTREFGVTGTGISLSKNEFCDFFGKSTGGKSHLEIKATLSRLRTTTLYQYEDRKLIRTFRLIEDYTWEIAEGKRQQNNNAEIVMDTAFLHECVERKFFIRWRAIQGLKSQVAKALLLYLDCNNPRIPKPGHEWNPWQPFVENRLFKFIYGLSKPTFISYRANTKKLGSMESQFEDFYAQDSAARMQYAIESKAYRKICREYRRQVNDAFMVLREQGLIEEFRRVVKNKNGVKTQRKLWIVKKNNVRIRSTVNVGNSVEDIIDTSDIPF